MASSLTKGVDIAVRALLYSRFGDILGIDQQAATDEECINAGVIQYPQDTALRNVAEKRGEDFLEFINFWRLSTSPSWDRNRTFAARRGIWMTYSDDNQLHAINVKAQPIDLNYGAWFWSKSLDKVYQCIEDYIFWQHDYPKIDISYEFDDDHSFTYSPDLHFGEIVDEGTAHTQYSTGLIHCFRTPIKVDGWVFRGSTTNVITKIIVTIYDKDDVTSYISVIDPDTEDEVELQSRLLLSKRTFYRIESISSSGKYVVVSNDRTSDFAVGGKFRIQGSTGNDNIYTVSSVALSGSNTKLGLLEAPVSDTADGSIYQVN
jgi:hypothetical protein